MNIVGRCKLAEERGKDIGEEDYAFGYVWANKVERGGEDDYVEDVVNQT
jgi:hypothetical protein